MTRSLATLSFSLLLLIAISPSACAEIEGRVWEVFEGAEQRFQPPEKKWFDETQQALREEAAQVSNWLEEQGAEYATAWKKHLHWHLLERNLGAISSVNVDELRQVRRWMYSNRKGLETEYFSEIRKCMDAYLDATETFAHDDLQATFHEKIASAKMLCQKLAAEPSDANAAALGRVLGWFETTGQLAEETATVRKSMSLPNAQVVISHSLMQRILKSLAPEVTETVPILDHEMLPPSGLLQRSRKLTIRGTAKTQGKVSLDITPNNETAEIKLVYHGTVDSRCHAITGPVTLHMRTLGSALAVKPIFLSPAGLTLGATLVSPTIKNTLEKVTATNPMFRRMGERRARKPEAKAYKDYRARVKTINLLKEELDQRVELVLDEIQTEFDRNQDSISQFSEVTAPLLREGASIYFHSASSSSHGVMLNGFSGGREHFGASFPCPVDPAGADFQAQVHVSFINNLAETILGGKAITDTFFMRYAKVLHAELPMPLMVHSRSKRWTVTMAKHRPLELVIPEPNHFQFIFRATGMELDGEQYNGSLTAKFTYAMVDNGFGEIELIRQGDVELETSFDTASRVFLQEKIAAFFAPAFRGGGVVIPDSGVMGALRDIQSEGVKAENEWIVFGVTVPPAVLDELLELRESNAGTP